MVIGDYFKRRRRDRVERRPDKGLQVEPPSLSPSPPPPPPPDLSANRPPGVFPAPAPGRILPDTDRPAAPSGA